MINQRIKERCDLAGLKQTDVARICEVSQSTVSNWWRDVFEIPIDAALKIRTYLGTTLDDICGEKYADERLRDIADIFSALDEQGKDYLLEQAKIAYKMKDFR